VVIAPLVFTRFQKLETNYDRIFRDEEKVWMVKDLFHYNLYGTGNYKARLQAIEAANAKIQEELDEKKVGVDYKVSQSLAVQKSSTRC
jgi:hypothetical protein